MAPPPDGKLSENFSPLENEWDRQDQLRWFSRDDPPPLQQPQLLKWRHWRPGKIREMEPTTQRALELHMRGKWAERLLAHFAPFAEHIAYMQDILGEDFRKEALDLLGDSRFRTLRQHCLVYESLRKRGFTVIPWQERHVRSLLNQLADEEVTPCKLRQVWNTLKWFSKTFGLLKIDELHRLKSKKSSLEEALTDTVTRPQRKAVVPSKEVIWALEEGGGYDSLGATGPGTQEAPGKNRHEVLDAFILGFARFQVGCSARFNDLQHVHPKDLIHTSNTVELKAWQTKTVSAARINRNPVPLIAPKYSFMASVRRLVSEEAFQDMDYLLPTVSKDFAGLIPRPSTPGLRLPDGDPPGAPHVPGQLAHEEHGRCLRTGEARRGCGDLGPGSAEGPQPEPRAGRERREDLNHPDWADPLPPPAVDITDAGPEGREEHEPGDGQGPVSSHPGPRGGGQTHGQRRPVQNPPAECGGHGRGMWLATSGLQGPGALGAGLHDGAGGLWQVRTLLQAAWVPSRLGTGAGRGRDTAGGLGLLGGLRLRNG